MHTKLFIPGPIEVSDKTYKAMTTPVFGHRSKDFVDLYQSIQPQLKELFGTQDPVFISTSSAWGVMEGSIRNTVKRKVLNVCSGAFSDKWYDVSLRCGKAAEALQYEWGEPIRPQDIEAKLTTGEFDAITFIHNETSTGTMNPIAEIMAVVRKFPDVISIVDTVTSFSAVPIPKDELGIDVLLTGSQKALALPPGMAIFSVSERAQKRALELEDRGYYFDFEEFLKNHEKGMTPSTPIIPLIFALRSKLEDIFAEGIENRYRRHEELNAMVHQWMEKHQLETLPPREFASKSLSCIRNSHNWDLAELNKRLKKEHHFIIDTGYGKLKGKTFRISNMGDETRATMQELLDALDIVIASM